MIKTVHLTAALPADWVAEQYGKHVDGRHYSTLVAREPTDVFKPDGQPLLKFRPGAIPRAICNRALIGLRAMPATENDHRNYWVSNAMGYYPCRQTTFTRDNLEGWSNCQSFIGACNEVFRRELPARYKNQRRVALRTDQRYVIGRTAFTTVTVNHWDAEHNARTTIHKDAGDLPEGFGVISVFRTGSYTGGYLVFPQYQVAVDMRTTDVLLCDVHEWHANTAIVGEPGWQRIACILYYRTQMQYCSR